MNEQSPDEPVRPVSPDHSGQAPSAPASLEEQAARVAALVTQRKPTWRERVGERLANWPILRTLVLNPVFGSLMILVLSGVLLFGISIPKMWRITPVGLQPVVRCSLLDLAQAWSLGRKGAEQMEAGDYEAAARSYFTASKNKLGDVDLLRNALRAFVKAGTAADDRQSRRASESARWMLHLSPTNQGDIFLAAQVYDLLGDSSSVRGLLQPLGDALPEHLYGAMAKAAFDSGDADGFAQWWQRAGKDLEGDPTLELYHAAWQAGWGPVGEQDVHLQELRQAAARLDQRFLANHLLLKVYRQRRNLVGYRSTLTQLESFNGDRLQDHVDYWLMLQAGDRGAQALELARSYAYPPRHALEVASLGQVLIKLGDAEAAKRLLERYGPIYGDGPAMITLPLWALLGDLYIADQEWDTLMRLGRDIRALPFGNATLGGFGWFIEGRGLVEVGERESAVRAFESAIREGFPSPAMGLEIADLLLKLGFPRQAQELLLPLEDALETNVRYWQSLFEAAYALRQDEALLFKAARRAMDLDPGNQIRRINYAVALLVSRQRPDEAARLTLDFLTANPKSALARVNHADALAMVGRAAEAERLLESVSSLGRPELTSSLALVRLKIALTRQDDEAARAALEQVDENSLFPTQQRWLASVRRQLAESATSR